MVQVLYGNHNFGAIIFLSGSIGIDELEGPLISLGIASSREEVQKIIDSVDEDGSGQIEFNEFLHIISSKNNDSSEGDQGIVDFFKGIVPKRQSNIFMAYTILQSDQRHDCGQTGWWSNL